MNALMKTRAKAVMIASIEYPEIKDFISKGALRFKSFLDITPDCAL